MRTAAEEARVTGTSNLGDAAVDEQFRAVDKAGVVRGEEQDGARDLVGLADPASRDIRRHPRLHPFRLGAAAKKPVEAGGVDRAGAHDIDADAPALEVEDPVP